MNYAWLCMVLCATTVASAAAGKTSTAEPTTRVVQSLDFDWKFFKADAKGADQVDYNDSNWRSVDLPHDWSIEGPFAKDQAGGKSGGYMPLGIGWYRKEFRLGSALKNKKVFIRFEGIYKNSDVWINGHHLGKRWYGYVSFQYDLTPYIKWGSSNVIAVRADNSRQTCRWYSGSGIYRHVWLIVTEKLYVGQWGTYVTTPKISSKAATVNVKTTVKNEHDVFKECTLKTIIVDGRGRRVGMAESEKTISAGEGFEFSQDVDVQLPKLWSLESPSLYYAHSIVLDDGRIVDRCVTPFGIRRIKWDTDKGLFLNDKPVLMKGVCIHHDLGSLGAAFHDRAMERRLEVLKSVGCNAIRTSHNPPAPGLLDMCDMMGFLVIDEAFDKWGGTNHATWPEDWRRDLASMLRRDRNHPSVVLWSVGNEVRGQDTKDTQDKLRMLVDFVRKAEPTRKVTCGTFPSYVPDFVAIQDVAGLNYQEQWFDRYRKNDPNILIISTESYVFYRGLGDSHKAFYPVNPWFDAILNDFVVGSFFWTGIDYLGEAVAGWPCHGWNCSLIDTCGFRRPVSFLHESLWSDEPMVHIVVIDDSLDVPAATKSHWDWPRMVSHWTLPELEGKEIRVATFTNCQSVELFVNDRSLGVQKLADFDDMIITWTVRYEPGTITAVAKGPGRIIRSNELRTAGDAARIVLKPDRQTIRADGRDLCHVEVNITDANGILVPDSSNLIRFEVSGRAKIIGVDNGDLRSTESYKADHRKAFYGKCMVILQSTGKLGQIHLAATSPGLSSDELIINSN